MDGGRRGVMPIRNGAHTSLPETTAVVSRLGYRPELDGVRGIAIIMVMLVHVHNWPRGGFIGVDVFFTLSGFLITTLLLEEWRGRGPGALLGLFSPPAPP